MSEIKDDPVVKGLNGLEALISRAGNNAKGLPPVEKWNPEFCGDIPMEIKADGTWFYMGTPIGRHALARLFSTVLRKDEDGKTYPGQERTAADSRRGWITHRLTLDC